MSDPLRAALERLVEATDEARKYSYMNVDAVREQIDALEAAREALPVEPEHEYQVVWEGVMGSLAQPMPTLGDALAVADSLVAAGAIVEHRVKAGEWERVS